MHESGNKVGYRLEGGTEIKVKKIHELLESRKKINKNFTDGKIKKSCK